MMKRRAMKQFTDVAEGLPLFLFRRLMEGIFIFVFFLALYVFLSLATYSVSDPSWIHVNRSSDTVINAGGQVGAYIAEAFYWLFGYFAYVIPIGVAYLAGLIVQETKQLHFNKMVFLLRFSGFLFFMFGSCAFLGLKPGWVGPDGRPGAGDAWCISSRWF